MTHRERQIVCGLFLSKFEKEALAYLGFKSFTEAFNTLGYGLQARPASIKNYRDELAAGPSKRLDSLQLYGVPSKATWTTLSM
jgi:hypothetical protein